MHGPWVSIGLLSKRSVPANPVQAFRPCPIETSSSEIEIFGIRIEIPDQGVDRGSGTAGPRSVDRVRREAAARQALLCDRTVGLAKEREPGTDPEEVLEQAKEGNERRKVGWTTTIARSHERR